MDYFNVVKCVKMLQSQDPRYNPIPDGDEELISRQRKLRVTVVGFFIGCLHGKTSVPVNPLRKYATEIVNLLQNGIVEDVE